MIASKRIYGQAALLTLAAALFSTAAHAAVTLNCSPTTGPERVSRPYSTTCTASGTPGPYVFFLSAGSFPGGISITGTTSSTVTIAGTPTAPGGAFDFTIEAFDVGAVDFGTHEFIGTVWPQLARTYVAGWGSDSLGCDRNNPCKTFATAQYSTLAGGEIDVLASGDFGTLAITKALTIDGGNNVASIGAGPVCNGNTALCINVPGATVTIRNLSLTLNTSYGIAVGSAGYVRVEHVVMLPAPGGSFAYGFFATAGMNSLDDVRVEGAVTYGVKISGASSKATISNSTISHAGLSGLVSTLGAVIQADNCLINFNQLGISTSDGSGTAGTLRLSNNTITDNVTGLLVIGPGASIVSFGNNRIFGNTTNGSATLTTTQR
ncbi:MAG TPA: right-handed parallel beta-helix repeat-containing protein [Candidatus Sulfopaludibacter sp.]|jgi:hypothetical protein|nr:right-handed parallel beta-helix repeat-containing protein [Candidatus Sulfopaludibacter sp.]